MPKTASCREEVPEETPRVFSPRFKVNMALSLLSFPKERFVGRRGKSSRQLLRSLIPHPALSLFL
jgi:hypothetical protein